MRVAVTDACIFIDLIDLDLISVFFRLDVEIHTTVSVMDELYIDQKQILENFRAKGKLFVHNLFEEDIIEMNKISFPRGLSVQDRSVIYLAKKLAGAMVITSDNLVRKFAKVQSLEVHGIFWVLDQLIAESFLSKVQGVVILEMMPTKNSLYSGVFMREEIKQRMILWKSEEII